MSTIAILAPMRINCGLRCGLRPSPEIRTLATLAGKLGNTGKPCRIGKTRSRSFPPAA